MELVNPTPRRPPVAPACAVAALICLLCLLACDNDIFGMLNADDLDGRWDARNTFNYLTDSERNLEIRDSAFDFIVVSDTHIDDGDTHGFERITEAAQGASFVVVTGDLTQKGDKDDIDRFLAIAAKLREESHVPCFPVIGNHDCFFGNFRNWKKRIGSTVYRVGGPESVASLYILDSANAFFGKTQLDWLESSLQKERAATTSGTPRRVFVFSHCNLFTESPLDTQQLTDTRERARVLKMFSGRVTTYFAGHVHRRILRTVGAVDYTTLEDWRDNRTYCRVRVTAEGVTYEFKRL